MNSSENMLKSKSIIGELIHQILKIPGDKIVTLAIAGLEPFIMEIKNGQFGDHPNHKVLFLVKMQQGVARGAGLTVREFLPLKVKRKGENGKDFWVPEKNLYGVFFKGDRWMGSTAEMMREAYEIDAQTGMPIPRQEGVHYKDFPIV